MKKGIKQLIVSLIMMFLGPMIVHSSLMNKDHLWFYIIFSVGVFGCLMAGFMAFKGIKNILRHIWN